MTAFLYRLGQLSHAHPWRVLAAWLLIILAVAGAGFGFGGKLSDGFTIPGTESQNALDRLDARPHRGAAVRRPTPPHRTRAGEVVVDLAPHRRPRPRRPRCGTAGR